MNLWRRDMRVRDASEIIDRIRFCQRELARARRLTGPSSPLPVGCRRSFRWLASALRREERALRWVLGMTPACLPYPGEGWAMKPGRRPPRGRQDASVPDRLRENLLM